MEKVTIRVFVKPNAKKSALVEIKDGVLHIALHAKPHEGEANKELCRFLAELYKVPKSQVILEGGEKSRHKVISLPKTK